MNLLLDAVTWLFDPAHWSGAGGIPTRMTEHVLLVAATVMIAAVIALPVGVLIGHAGRGAGVIGAVTGAARAVPTLGLLTLFGLAFGIGLEAPLLALIILAIPSLLAGAYAGVQAMDHTIPAAARAIGLSPLQVILRVEVPLALPVIVGGIRAATLQVVATATLAAYTADVGLGRYLFAGLKSRDYPEMLAGALLVAILAVILELFLAYCQHLASTRIAHPTTNSQQSTAESTPTRGN